MKELISYYYLYSHIGRFKMTFNNYLNEYFKLLRSIFCGLYSLYYTVQLYYNPIKYKLILKYTYKL